MNQDEKRLVAAAAVDSVGFGAYLSLAVLYLTIDRGLTSQTVGLGLTLAAVVSFMFNLVAGSLADRFGAKPVAVTAMFSQGVICLVYLVVRGPAALVAVIVVLSVASKFANVSRNTLLAEVSQPKSRTVAAARLRTGVNAGLAVGAAVGGLFAVVSAFRAGIVLNAISFGVAAVLLLPVRPVRREASKRRSLAVPRDRGYVAAGLLLGLAGLYNSLMVVGIPLVVQKSWPHDGWLVSEAILVNTAMVLALQVPVSKRLGSLAAAPRALALALVTIAAGIAGMALLSRSGGPGAAAAVIAFSAVLVSAGEVAHQTVAWSVGYGLADESRMGHYQGGFALLTSVDSLLGPAMVGLALGISQSASWLVFAVGFLVFAPIGSGVLRVIIAHRQ